MTSAASIVVGNMEPFGKGPRDVKLHGVKVETQIVISGGYQTDKFVPETKEVEGDNGVDIFVKVRKNVDWLMKCARGKHEGQKGCLKRCSLLDELTRKVEKMEAERVESALSAVAGDAENLVANSTVVEDLSDPMSMLDPLEGDFETPRKAKNARRGRNLTREIINEKRIRSTQWNTVCGQRF